MSGLTSTTQLSAVEEILSSDELPAVGSVTAVNGSVLWLRKRAVNVNESNTLADVMLSYEGGAESGGTENVLRRGGRAALAQITTIKDRDGNQLLVTHEGHEQTGEMSVFIPQANPFIETMETTNDPDALLGQWIGRVNSASWRGKDAGKWIINDVSYEEFDRENNLWKFQWSFLESTESQGWLPVIAFIDPETNKPPVGLVADEGYKKIPWYLSVDFNSKFT